MLYRHVFGRISSEFHGILWIKLNFRGSATAQNIRSPAYFWFNSVLVGRKCQYLPFKVILTIITLKFIGMIRLLKQSLFVENLKKGGDSVR